MQDASDAREFGSISEFYPFYLGEHRDGTCRVLHIIGTSLGLATVAYGVVAGPLWVCATAPLPGYALAWVGHYVFEKNRPATFKHPLWSFMCDWWMWAEVLSGRLPALGRLPQSYIDARRPG